jgi:uncharacterized membrane protein
MTGPGTTPQQREHHKHLLSRHYGDGRSLSDRVADRFVTVFGGWSYIIWQTVVIVIWMAGNAWFLHQLGMRKVPDPYPFILLNLAFSAQAAYAAPLILMAQNRGARRDKDFATHQFEIIGTTHQMLAANTDLTQQVHLLATTIAAQTATLDEIHRHVQAMAPQAGQFPAPAAPQPKRGAS